MDTKNVIAAISLSAAVIILYSLFFAPSPNELKKIDEPKSSLSSEAPKLEESEKIVELSRDQALKESNRVKFENQNIKGSISLIGGTIDDLIFKNYTETLDGKNKITLLNPKKYSEGYFVETGWVSSSKNIELPSSNTSWKVEGNNKLTPGNPVTLVWNNNQGISFKKKIKIDEKFLFSIDQIITNQSEKSYDFYAYGQIIRNKSPEVTNFYILHEGLIGVLNDQLVEKDYDALDSTPSLVKRLTLSEEDAIRAQFMQCWSIPLGIPYDDTMIVKIKIYLNTDGSLLKTPEVVQHERMNKPSEKYFRTLAESALRAVRRCDPIKVPDVERYDNWKNLQLNFDPREILRG